MRPAGDAAGVERPSIQTLRARAQPPEVFSRRNAEHWAGRVYMRRLSIYLTWLALRARVSANAMTAGMMALGLGAAAAFSVRGLWWAVLGALLVQAYLLADCSDGEIARWSGNTSAVGIYLDRLGHYVVEAALLVALGLRAGGWDGGRWTIWGLVAALIHLVGKAETDLVEVARAKHGLPSLPDDAESAAPRSGTLAALRALAGRVPVYRLTGAVEASFLILAVAVVDEIRGSYEVTRALTLGMVAIAVYVALGHLAMILASRRLRA